MKQDVLEDQLWLFSNFFQDTIVKNIVVHKTCLRLFLMKKYFMAVSKSYPLGLFL